MSRLLSFLYGVVAYLTFFGTFLYAIGFVGNVAVPKSIDSGAAGPVVAALIIDALLLTLFALQHSVMARPGFKRWWTRYVPKGVERSTYVLLASLALLLLFWQWRPMPGVVWAVGGGIGAAVLWALFAAGWLTVLASTFMISHAELFGLKQVHAHLRGRQLPEPRFATPALYRVVRHPIMLGFLVGFWATPVMTAGHLLFALATTGYILVAVQLEERDLVHVFGREYEEYRARVPGFVPGLGGRQASAPAHVRVQNPTG